MRIYSWFLLLSLLAIQSELSAAGDAREHILFEGNIGFVKQEANSQNALSEPLRIKILGSEDSISSFNSLVLYGEDIIFDSSRFLLFVKGVTKIEEEVDSLVSSKPRCIVIDTLECSISYCSEIRQSIRTPLSNDLKNVDLCN